MTDENIIFVRRRRGIEMLESGSESTITNMHTHTQQREVDVYVANDQLEYGVVQLARVKLVEEGNEGCQELRG